jgi:hypothetical protein
MPRRTQRLIATLLVWIAILFTVGIVLGRVGFTWINSYSGAYWPGNVVTGGDAETATRLLGQIQEVNNEVWQQSQMIASELYTQYALWMIALVAIMLAGAVISTFFIWRSVYLPEMQSPADESLLRAGKRHLLDDDDEASPSESTPATRRRAN